MGNSTSQQGHKYGGVDQVNEIDPVNYTVNVYVILASS